MKRKNVLQLSGKEGKINKENNNKIELLNCQLSTQKCEKHLTLINKSYINASNYHLDKDYLNSINSLKRAYNKACELKDSSCSKCSAFFRLTITNSLENINQELSGLTTGVFRKKRYQHSYIESCNALNELKNKDQ